MLHSRSVLTESLRGLTNNGFAIPEIGALEALGSRDGEPIVWINVLIGWVYQFGLLAYLLRRFNKVLYSA